MLHWQNSHFGFGDDSLDPIPASPPPAGPTAGEAMGYHASDPNSPSFDEEWFTKDYDPLQPEWGVAASIPKPQRQMGMGLAAPMMQVGRGALPRMPVHGRIGRAPARHPVHVGKSLPQLAGVPSVAASLPVVVPAAAAAMTPAAAGAPAPAAVHGDIDDVYYGMVIAEATDPYALGG